MVGRSLQHLAMTKWTASTLEGNTKKTTDNATNKQCSHDGGQSE